MDSPGKNTGLSCHALLQGIFLTQGLSPCVSYVSCLAGGFFTTSATWDAPHISIYTGTPCTRARPPEHMEESVYTPGRVGSGGASSKHLDLRPPACRALRTRPPLSGPPRPCPLPARADWHSSQCYFCPCKATGFLSVSEPTP